MLVLRVFKDIKHSESLNHLQTDFDDILEAFEKYSKNPKVSALSSSRKVKRVKRRIVLRRFSRKPTEAMKRIRRSLFSKSDSSIKKETPLTTKLYNMFLSPLFG